MLASPWASLDLWRSTAIDIGVETVAATALANGISRWSAILSNDWVAAQPKLKPRT